MTRPRARSGARTAKTSMLQRAVTGAVLYGLSFAECDTVFDLLPGAAERAVRMTMRGEGYAPAVREVTPARKRGGR